MRFIIRGNRLKACFRACVL